VLILLTFIITTSVAMKLIFLYFQICWSILSFCIIGVLSANAVNRVAVKAEALDSFLTERARNPEKKLQTYLFMKGKYYGGNSRDDSMDDVTFENLVEDIAAYLRNQNFFPEPEHKTSDLLIVVHYGVTSGQADSLTETMGHHSIEELSDPFGNTGYIWKSADELTTLDGEDVSELYEDSSAGPSQFPVLNNIDPGVEFNYNASLSMEEAHYRAAYAKAQLLGMEEAYSHKGSPRDELMLNTMINEERYFVVLMAWDYQKLLNGESELVWRTRYSIRSLGQSFEDGINQMNKVAGDYFGMNMKGLINKRADDRSNVKMGEIEVLSDEPEGKVN